MGKAKKWTKEDLEYLEDKWGVNSITNICDKLGRTESAIRLKAYRLGLGRFTENGDYITFNQLIKSFGLDNSHSYKRTGWIKRRGLPVKSKLIKERRVNVVNLKEFWRWAEKNKNSIDFSNLPRYELGKEPVWVEQKRQYDIQLKTKFKTTPWTSKEDEYLKFLLKQFKYSYSEISSRLCRTVGSIERRIVDLKLKERPIKADNSVKWKDEEIKELSQYIELGMGYELMSERLGKSSKALRGKVYRLYGTENLDKAILIMRGN